MYERPDAYIRVPFFFTIIARNRQTLNQLFYINGVKIDETIQKVLSMRVGERHYSFAITDKAGAELYSLAYYVADEMNADRLAEIFSNHPELHSSFDDVQVGYDHAGSVLVPKSFNDPGQAKNILNMMNGSTIGTSVFSERVKEWELVNVYAVPEDVKEWTERMFPTHKYRHNYTLAIGMMSVDPSDHILIDLNKEEFSFIVVKEGRLHIAQTLYYSSPEDILYYLLKTCNQFSLSRGEIQLFISGLIEKESQLFRELYLNFLNITFREPTWKVPPVEDKDYPTHFFTSLNDLARCES